MLFTGLVYANGIYFSLGTDFEGDNCFSINPASEYHFQENNLFSSE